MKQQFKIIDGDGHIFEDGEGIARHFPYTETGGRLRGGVFPTQSHIQFSLTHRPPGSFGIGSDGRFHNPGPEGWIEFMDQIGFDYAVLFPTAGQRIGRIVDRDYAVGAARAYNDWLAEDYLRRDSRFKGIGILPMHDPEAALEELRHAYTELGMGGVLFPATGVHLNLGAKPYWPLYAEAARLGCPVVVHGGGHWDLGMETMNVSTGANAMDIPCLLRSLWRRWCSTTSSIASRGCGWPTWRAGPFGSSWPWNAFPALMRRELPSILAANCCTCPKAKPSVTTSAGSFRQVASWWALKAAKPTLPMRSR